MRHSAVFLSLTFLTIVCNDQVKLFGHSSHLDQFSQILLLSQAAAFLGGDNMFKRYSFENGKTVLVNGYSITMHEEAMKPENFTRIEQTWRHDWELAYPTRELIPERLDMPGWAVKQTFYLVRPLLSDISCLD